MNSCIRSSVDIESVVDCKEDGGEPKDNKDNDNLEFDKSVDCISV